MALIHPRVRDNLKRIKRIIGIYSGKGGVGKTTIAVNVAAFLAHKGYRVCLLDADIDCPNVALALGITGELDLDILDKRIIPHKKHNLRVVSMASLQEKEDDALVWRGPMLTDMLLRFLGTTVWGTADYLIIDLPPGTADVPLTLLNFLKPDGIIIVTTPRNIAEVDARKSANLAKMTGVKVLGVIENMSGGVFGTGKGKMCAESIQAPYLGEIAFDQIYLRSIDEGYPAVLRHEEAMNHIESIVAKLHDAEEQLLGSRLPTPMKGLAHAAKNILVDFKDEILDRYTNKEVYMRKDAEI